MLLRLFAALLLLLAPSFASADERGFPIAEMMRATALDEVFTQFGPAIAASARSEQITADEIFLKHWEATAIAVFNAKELHRELAEALDGKFSSEEQRALGAFFRSDFGREVTALERANALLDPAAQTAALAEGASICARASPARAAQYDRLMQLVGAEISAAMVGQSVRALLVGMAVAHQRGQIEVPWEEIDAQVDALMPDLVQRVTEAQRSMMAYAYRDLSEADLDRYIAFLDTPPAQRFYALAAFAVGRIVAAGMSDFGTALAARMASVNV